MTVSATFQPIRKPSFRVAPWYSALTLPFRFAAAPAWGSVYRCSLGVRMLKELSVEEWKRGNTAFILGSGPSINDLTDAQWARIRRDTSIGFNWWLNHPHVPNLYVFENVSERHRELLTRRASDYAETPLVLKQFLSNFSPAKHLERLRLLRTLPDNVRRSIHMSSDLIVPGRTVIELRRGYRLMQRLGLLRMSDHFQWVPKRTASLTFLVAVCARAGFEQIVLCGVDLNRPGYFFESSNDREDPSIPPGTDKRAGQTLHMTEDPRAKVLPISEVLRAFTVEVLAPRGISLHVGHRGSALAAIMPVYPWNDGESAP